MDDSRRRGRQEAQRERASGMGNQFKYGNTWIPFHGGRPAGAATYVIAALTAGGILLLVAYALLT